ncbi:MAG: metallophosphoesterase family protein [Chloroflexi bacterium]|nr:metallophosphoesterase family protein [Chloroflexota bacterium]
MQKSTRILICSDIHSNIEALQACLADAQARGGFDRFWSIGDVVGYGPDPVAVLDELRALGDRFVGVQGNHDRLSVKAGGLHPRPDWWWQHADYRNFLAMTATDRAFIRSWPHDIVDLGFRLVHDPDKLYVEDASTAGWVLAATRHVRHVVVGHSHKPGYFVTTRKAGDAAAPTERFRPLRDGDVLEFEAGRRYLINPGGLGQPRDRDASAPYLLASIHGDSVTIEARRVEYDMEATIAKLRDLDYPTELEWHLRRGTG